MMRAIALVALWCSAWPAWGYVTFPYEWQTLPMGYKINANSVPQGLTGNEAVAAINTSFQVWGEPLCTRWRAFNAGSTNVTTRNSFDAETSVFWINDAAVWDADSKLQEAGNPDIVLGTTPIFFSTDSQTGKKYVTNADVVLNASRHKVWGVNGSTQDASVIGAQAVIAHEVGHLLGLDHSPDEAALMYYAYSPNVKTLRQDDIDGVCAKYPNSCPPGLKDCGTGCKNIVSDSGNCGGCGIVCANGLVCQGGSCVCNNGLASCGGNCVDLQTNLNHCGSCDHACGVNQNCSGGNCACNGSLTLCGNTCVDTTQDRLHCGSCSVVCPNDGTCVASLCTTTPADLAGIDATQSVSDAAGTDSAANNDDGGMTNSPGGCHMSASHSANLPIVLFFTLALLCLARFRKNNI